MGSAAKVASVCTGRQGAYARVFSIKNARILLSSKDGLLNAELRDLPVRLGLQWQH